LKTPFFWGLNISLFFGLFGAAISPQNIVKIKTLPQLPTYEENIMGF
jgi:hypothetical protein